MTKKIITIITLLLIVAGIGVVLANNKAKIDKAAKPVKEIAVIPVKVVEAANDSFNTSFTINGMTAPSKEVKVASEVQGKLVGLYIKNGDMVSAGQVIATLDGSVYNAQLNSIETSLAKAQLDMQRYARLIEMGGATPMQYESAKLQQQSLLAEKRSVLQQLSHMQIRAPFSGKIENVAVELGSFVSFGTILSDLINISSLKINVYLSEQEAMKTNLDQPVTISSPVLTESRMGKVSMISDKADATGKFLAEISFANNGDEKIKAGIIADVSFTLEKGETGLAIPASAVVGTMKEARVFVAKSGRVESRAIKTGVVINNKVQVLEGLQAGEQVVISGQINLENGSPITINQ